MIHFATECLRIQDGKGYPCKLDIGELERELLDSFQTQGFRDVWMAEETALMVEEQVRANSAKLYSRAEIDRLVKTVLEASGYCDVAREYASRRVPDPLASARAAMCAWTTASLTENLRRSLPVGEAKAESLAAKVAVALERDGLRLVSEDLTTALALHFLVNESATPSGAVCWRDNLAEGTSALLEHGVLRVMPCSALFPRIRVSLGVAALGEQLCGGWLSEIALGQAIVKLAPALLDLLKALRDDWAAKRMMDGPAHLLLPRFRECLADAGIVSRPVQNQFQDLLSRLLRDEVQAHLPFALNISFR